MKTSTWADSDKARKADQRRERDNARHWIATEGRERARRKAEAELFRAVNDVTYPFGRVALFRALLDELNGEPEE